MFARFTDPRRVVVLAQEEARMLNHDYIGTEHILLGLIHEGQGVGAKVLESLGIALEGVRQQVEGIIGQGQQAPSGHIPFTPRTKKVLELSLREAQQLGHNYIGTEHILLGLIREGEGVAAQVLVKGADLNRVRQQVLQLLSGYPGKPTASADPEQSPASAGPEESSAGAKPPTPHIFESFTFKSFTDRVSFARFSDRARRVGGLAQEEARMLNHDYIGTEHILLGLIHEGQGVGAKVLESLGIALEGVRQQVEGIISQGQRAPLGLIPFTPRAKKVLELSWREALQLGHNYIGTEHILLGLIREGEGVAAQVLVNLGADLTRVREEVRQLPRGYQG